MGLVRTPAAKMLPRRYQAGAEGVTVDRGAAEDTFNITLREAHGIRIVADDEQWSPVHKGETADQNDCNGD